VGDSDDDDGGGWHGRGWRVLAGGDGADRAGLPWAEALAPLPLAALALVVVNDWLLKPAVGAQAGWLTGKLSDVAGVIVAPLVATAVVDLGAWALARLGAPLDWTLRRWKLALAIAITAAGVVAVKLSAGAAGAVARGLGGLGFDARIVVDPTDLLALPALGLAWWQGRRALARGAHGRLAWLAAQHRRGVDVPHPFADAVQAGADPARVAELEAAAATWLAGGPSAPVDRALARLRGTARP